MYTYFFHLLSPNCQEWSSLALPCSPWLSSLVNLSISLVLLLCAAPCPGLHTALCSPWSPRQADEGAATTHSRLYPPLLAVTSQGAAFHHIHFPCAHFSGCTRLFLHVSLNILLMISWDSMTFIIQMGYFNCPYLIFFSALVWASTRNPGYINWALWLWLASCLPTQHTLASACTFPTITTQGPVECKNSTGCCQPPQVGTTLS